MYGIPSNDAKQTLCTGEHTGAGTFRLRSGLSQLENDEQVYNGVVYPNWGFGAGPNVLSVVVAMFCRLVVRRERDIARYAPYALKAFLFASIFRRGEGFA